MSKHNAYLKDENLLTLFSLNNLIVPEIQREYVWGNNSDVLEKFLQELEKKAEPCEECHHVHTSRNINVGFLYSYKPSYVRQESERIFDEFLIDGQQRITTLFLLLLYRATVEGRLDDFTAIVRAEEEVTEMGFNYKVRGLTQEFLLQLIRHAKEVGEKAFDFIDDLDNLPHWFLDDYRHDPTVMSMISALRSIKKIFGNPDNFYFNYLLTNIHFWHFKTEATSQGEELYITMNSRGEQLSNNEMQKARALPADKMVDYGREWESWQTFFWRNRKKGGATNPNADKGFNNFLACIEALETFNGSLAKDTNLDVSVIKTCFDGFNYIVSQDFRNKIDTIYNGRYTQWFDKFLELVWKEINTSDTSWVVNDPRGGDEAARKLYINQSPARNKSMLFWSWMTYFRKCEGSIDDSLLVRLIHFYYIRYQCFKRSSTSIETIIDTFIATNGKIHATDNMLTDDNDEDNTNSKVFSEEELLLSRFYFSEQAPPEELESAIWEIQDLPYFIDGKYLGGNTVYEFFADSAIIDREQLPESIDMFKSGIISLMGENPDKTSLIDVKRILLFYHEDEKCFWLQQSPWYYTNYETCEWRRIVRTRNFNTFYKEFKSKGLGLAEFLEYKRHEFFAREENRVIDRSGQRWDDRRLVILYDLLALGGSVWDEKHENIALWNDNENHNEKIFIEQPTLWKGTRYYDSKALIELSPDWAKALRERYGVEVIDPVVPEPETETEQSDNLEEEG